ncbi:MAG TPA: imelysin family protein [Bacteroidota bacterium]|nr:imelysin family protein [Bacteroidota bacterium]
MKKLAFIVPTLIFLFFAGCNKNPTEPSPTPAGDLEGEVLTDFANVVVNPNYADLQVKASALNQKVSALDTASTDENLAAAQNAWRITRGAWETSEGYLFGPIEDFNYDPSIDTWPLNKTDLDSLLASANPLMVSDIDALPYSLKGFHAIEYILFGTAHASQLTSREKQYLSSLTQSLYNTTAALRNSWDPASGNFTGQLIDAGKGSERFATRKDAFLAIVAAMSDICNEVADEKMQDPLVAHDSTLDESAFSHNSTTDFTCNITGVANAYFGKYTSDGHGLNEIVAAQNISLDNKIQAELNAAIQSFGSINSSYEEAIYSEQVQIHSTQNAINNLKNTLDEDLTNFIQANIKD